MAQRKPHRVADDLTAGMKAIERIIASGKRRPNSLRPARSTFPNANLLRHPAREAIVSLTDSTG